MVHGGSRQKIDLAPCCGGWTRGGGAAISSRDLIELSNYLWTPDKDGQLPACLAVDRSGAACSAHMKLPAVKTDGIYILAWKRHAGSDVAACKMVAAAAPQSTGWVAAGVA